MRITLLLPLSLFACALWSDRLQAQTPQQLIKLRGIIIVANGSGGTVGTTRSVLKAVGWSGLNVGVVTQHWSKEQGPAYDHNDVINHHRHGMQIAQAVSRYRSINPALQIVLLGHSSGNAVVLAAAKYLPPDSVDRIVLLAPSVSCSYDLRPALRTSRYGIDSFYSEFDVTLGIATDMFGTADGMRNKPSAGVVGFSAYWTRLTEPKLLWKLRQYKWNEGYFQFGANGAHYSWTNSKFIFSFVLPGLFPTPSQDGDINSDHSTGSQPKTPRQSS